ncbi:MAG: DUF1853 family protein [Pseudomonadota bacterium]
MSAVPSAHTPEPDWLRDLRWLLLSPPLLSTVPGAHPALVQQFTADEVALIDAWLQSQAVFPHPPYQQATAAANTASPLPTQAPPRRLGRHAEQLLSHFLQAGPTHRGHAAHLALRQTLADGSTTTVGEIDFLVEDRHGQRWHWELAVKFYLCAPPGLPVPHGQELEATTADYVGPQRRDDLDRKLHKLFRQQLRHAPPPPWSAHTWQPAAFVRGRLFYPWGHTVHAPEALNPAHLRARWVHADAWPATCPVGVWRRLDRGQWLAPGPPSGPVLSETALREVLQAAWAEPERRPVMLAGYADDRPTAPELERLWVMPPGW